MGIRKKMAKGAFWLFLEKGVQQISSFVVFAVVARLIGPEAYGLVALCGMVLLLMNNITSGLVDAVISMRVRDDLRLSSLFWVVTGGGALLSLLTYFIAYPFSSIFGQEKLAPLLQAFAIMPFLFSIASIPTALITSTMNFRVFTIRTLMASLLGGTVGIVCALRGWGSFSIAMQQIISQIAIVVVVWKCSTWRPRFVFSTKALWEMLRLGLGQTGILFVSFFEYQTPRFILGYFFGPTMVGYYSFVLRVCSAIQDGILQPVLAVVYPAIVDILEDHKAKKAIIRQTIFVMSSLIIPVVVGVVLTAPIFVPLFFGKEWIPATLFLQIHTITTFTYSINLILRNILQAHRFVWPYLRVQLLIVALSIPSYFYIISLGATSVVILRVLITFLFVISTSFLVWKKTKIHLGECYHSMVSPFLVSLFMGTIVFFVLKLDFFSKPTVINLLVISAAGALCYTGIFLILERSAAKEAYEKTKELFLEFKNKRG